MIKLEPPKGLKINFKPSERQYEVWKALEPGVCDLCGSKLEMAPCGYDKNGNQIFQPKCTGCGNTDIAEQILGGGAAGGGKMLLINELVLTSKGFVELKDLKIGDKIISGYTGEETQILFLHPIEERECLRINFTDNTFIDCSKEHLWPYASIADYFNTDRSFRHWPIKSAEKLQELLAKKEGEIFLPIFNQNIKEQNYKQIKNIEPIGIRTGRCITIEDPTGLFITKDNLITHNSYLGCCWLIKSCMQFSGIRMVVARKERSTLLRTTWRTLMDVLDEWGLKRDVNYHIDNLRYVVTFWNNSEILCLHLAQSPNDIDYNWLGSLEITGAFVDEAGEVPEKGIEVLASRTRYKIAETFVVGKLFMCSNPVTNWVRDTFVMTPDGDPVQLAPGLRYIPFSLFDNPNEKFRAVYYNKLSKLRNPADKQRLMYGNWLYTEKNNLAAYTNFNGDIHLVANVKEHYYDPLKPLILSLDFNVVPYMSCLPMQIDFESKKIYVFPEYIGYPKDKRNNTPAFSAYVATQLKKESHVGGILLTGDPSGASRSTLTEEGVNNFTLFQKNLAKAEIEGLKIQLLNKQPAQITRLEFINELFNGYKGWQILIDQRCHRLIEDFSYQRKNPDGTKEKKKVVGEGGVRYEKWGHFSDCFDYALVYYLNKEYSDYRTNNTEIITTIDRGTQVYGEFEF